MSDMAQLREIAKEKDTEIERLKEELALSVAEREQYQSWFYRQQTITVRYFKALEKYADENSWFKAKDDGLYSVTAWRGGSGDAWSLAQQALKGESR